MGLYSLLEGDGGGQSVTLAISCKLGVSFVPLYLKYQSLILIRREEHPRTQNGS